MSVALSLTSLNSLISLNSLLTALSLLFALCSLNFALSHNNLPILSPLSASRQNTPKLLYTANLPNFDPAVDLQKSAKNRKLHIINTITF